MVTACRGCIAALLLALATAADAAALVEHSLDAGRSFITAGRIHLKDEDAVSGMFERQPISSTQLSQLQELVESDRCAQQKSSTVELPSTHMQSYCLATAMTDSGSPETALCQSCLPGSRHSFFDPGIAQVVTLCFHKLWTFATV